MVFVRSLKMNLLVGAFVPITILLGLWQLERGAEKRDLEMAYLDKLTTLPVPPMDADMKDPFRRIKLTGEFLPQYYLVDNQVRSGQTGYWVVHMFRTARQTLLVNRGFVAAPPFREQLPEVDWPRGLVRTIGAVWPDTGLIPVYDQDQWTSRWPKRVQRRDIARMAKEVAAEPVEIRLEAGQVGTLAAAPFAEVLSDDKHLGYAATWFGLCGTLVILYFYFGWRQEFKDE
jgi:surfeit locus 1 family protein